MADLQPEPRATLEATSTGLYLMKGETKTKITPLTRNLVNGFIKLPHIAALVLNPYARISLLVYPKSWAADKNGPLAVALIEYLDDPRTTNVEVAAALAALSKVQ